MTKIVDTLWISGQDCIGLITTINDQEEIKFYIGVGAGNSEEADARHISEWGTKVTPQMFQYFFDKYKKQ